MIGQALTPPVLWIDDPAAAACPLLGGKFASLAEMSAAGFDVPPGFGITTAGYRHFLRCAGLEERSRDARSRAARSDLTEIQAISAELTAAINNAPMPPDLENEMRTAYTELERRTGEPMVPVAVRSSGESEDLAGASFAGQYDTFLWIRGADDLLAHVRRCWAGMFGAAVLTYRSGDEHATETDHGICVGIQQMVPARSAGVMFTLDPVTGDRSKAVIEGCWGLGEGVVGGCLTPSRYVVDKVTLEISKREIPRQESMYGFDPTTATVGLVPVDESLRDAPCLTDAQIRALVELAKRIERHRAAPQDIEWAVSDTGRVHVLQVRPETVWAHRQIAQLVTERKSAVGHVLARFSGIKMVAPTSGPAS